MCQEWLQPVALEHAVHGYKALKSMRMAQPCLMQQSPVVAGLVNRWTPLHLVSSAHAMQAIHPALGSANAVSHPEHCNPRTIVQGKILQGADVSLQVFCSATGKSRFIECDADRNAFGSHYHVREPETQLLDMSLHGYMECVKNWQFRQLHLKVTDQYFSDADVELPACYIWHTYESTIFQSEDRRSWTKR